MSDTIYIGGRIVFRIVWDYVGKFKFFVFKVFVFSFVFVFVEEGVCLNIVFFFIFYFDELILEMLVCS